jgi:hypothetical protein
MDGGLDVGSKWPKQHPSRMAFDLFLIPLPELLCVSHADLLPDGFFGFHFMF